MKIIDKVARQGDVMLVRIDALPIGLTTAPRDRLGRIVLALGETSGHCHAIRDAHVTGLRMAGSEDVDYIEVGGSGPATLTHEYESGTLAEHEPIGLPPGTYRVVRQREYSPEAIKRVVD
jgi:hypothetical protein